MAVEKFPDEISAIRAMLSEHPEGLTIRSISALLGMNRNSVAKYLEMLQMQGGLTLKRSGPSKIYCLADKLPAAAVLKLTKSHVIIFDQLLTAADVNDSFTDLLKISKEEILGKCLEDLPFVVQSHPGLLTLIKEGIRGKESKTSASIKTDYRLVPCMLTCSPVFFENGSSGVSLIIDLEQESKNGDGLFKGTDDSFTGLDETEYICRFSQDGTLTYVNQAYSNLLQRTKTDLIGDKWRPTIPESEYKKIRKCLLSLDRVHPVASLEIKVITPLGNSQWQRWKFRMLSGRTGQSAGYQATGLDITELKNLEQKVVKSADDIASLLKQRKVEIQDLNKQIFDEIASHEKTHFQFQFTEFAMDNASYMITWIARDGRFVYMNKEAQKVLGYQYRDVIQKKFIDIFAGVFSFPWDEIWETLKKDQRYTLEITLMTSKGKEIPVEMVLNYLKSKDKEYCCCFAKDITEKKQAENALRESEEKYRVIFNNEIYAICIFDFDTLKLLDVNDAYIRMYGYTRNELLSGMTIHDITAEHEASDSATETARKEGTIFIPLRYHKKKDGTIFPVEIVGGPYEWKGKRVMFVLSHDITDRMRVENALRVSEEKYRQLVDLAQAGIWAIDADGNTSYVNPRMAKMLGYTVEEMLGKHLFSFMDDAGKTIAAEQMERRRQGNKEDHEFEFITKEGVRIYSALSIAPIKDDIGIYKGAFAIVSDITGRKKVEASLKESEHKYRTLIENIPEKIFIKDASLAYVSCNEHYARDLGIAAEAIVNKTDFDFYSSDLAEKYRADDREIMESGYSRRIEEPYITDGTESWISILKTPIRDDAGNVSGILGIFHDITKRKQREEDFRKKTLQQLQASYENLQRTETDLQLHQTELEVQNEELRQAQLSLEVSRQRYFELYDLAPAGYLTISGQGLILHANLTAATLLGVERHQLEEKSFTRYIVPDDQDIFYHCRKKLDETLKRQSCELRMLHGLVTPFWVQIIAVPSLAGEGDKASISLMIFDIYGHKNRGEK
ncbi:MAG: PAS domain S-box protein [Methanoregula sp.]|nr:PAS domain S-box protein [Methanoregula sp.]